MPSSTQLGLRILGAALALGILGDALLRATPWGINVGIWTVLLAVAVVLLAAWQRVPLRGDGRWLMLASVPFALACAWRDSLPLQMLNVLALLTCLGLAAATTRVGQVRIAGLTNYAIDLLLATGHAIGGILLVFFRDVRWTDPPSSRWHQHAFAVGRGLLLAIPLAFAFGGLLASADAMFAQLVNEIIRIDLADVFVHLFFVGMVMWGVGGYLRQLFAETDRSAPANAGERVSVLGVVETVIVLGTLDAIFLAFVLVQFRYFFGGAAVVEGTTTLTYAEYARRGFFELVTVAALALSLLLAADWALRRNRARDEWLFRVLAGAMIAMLYVIMASAVQRMLLYQSEYGLTELRVYTTAFMGWLAVLFLWFLATVLRRQRQRFAFGALVSGLVAIAVLNGLNPDALIVGTNVSRPRFDVGYNTSLSADAVPALVNALATLPEDERRVVAVHVLARWSPPSVQDWRSANLARAAAWDVVNRNEAQLRAWAGPAGVPHHNPE